MHRDELWLVHEDGRRNILECQANEYEVGLQACPSAQSVSLLELTLRPRPRFGQAQLLASKHIKFYSGWFGASTLLFTNLVKAAPDRVTGNYVQSRQLAPGERSPRPNCTEVGQLASGVLQPRHGLLTPYIMQRLPTAATSERNVQLNVAIEKLGFRIYHWYVFLCCASVWACMGWLSSAVVFMMDAAGEPHGDWVKLTSSSQRLTTEDKSLMLGLAISAGGFANALIGVGSDSMGRITTIFMCILMCDFAVTGFGMVRSKLALMAVLTLCPFMKDGPCLPAGVLLAEWLPLKWRSTLQVSLHMMWNAGRLGVTVLWVALPPAVDWKAFFGAVAALPLALTLGFALRGSNYESPRWFAVDGNMTRCIEQLQRVKEADDDGSDDVINMANPNPAMEGQEVQHRSWHDRLSELLAPDVRSPLLVLCCAYFMLGYYNSGLFYWLIEYFKSRGMEQYVQPAMMAGPCGKVAGVVLLVLGGPEICVIDRFRRVPLIQLGFFGGGALLLMIAATSSPILAVGALFISAIFEEMIWSVGVLAKLLSLPSNLQSMAFFVLPLLAVVPLVAQAKPHVLFILADDYGWGNMGVHRRDAASTPEEQQGKVEVHTPNMDALIDEGILLERHYTYKICSPTRSSIQSGRLAVHVNPVNSAVTSRNYNDPVSGYAGIPRNMTGIAEKLRDGGYRTHIVGKWDAGMATPEHSPKGRGYESWYGYYQHANDYWHKSTVFLATGEIDACLNRMRDLSMHNETYSGPVRDAISLSAACQEDEESDPGCYEEHLFKQRVLKIIQNHDTSKSENPLFLFYSFHLLHTPLQVPKAWLEKLDALVSAAGGKPIDSENRRLYAAMTLYMDAAIGEAVDALKQKKMYDNTLIIFTSDNGGPIYEPGAASNHPLRGGKYTDWDGGVRTNAWVSGGFVPQKRRGAKYTGIINVADWYGTLTQLAGVDMTDHKSDKANQFLKEKGLPLLHPVDSVPQWDNIINDKPGRTGPMHLSSQAVLRWPFKLVTGKQVLSTWQGPLYPNCSTVHSLKDQNGPLPPQQDMKVFGEPLPVAQSQAEIDRQTWTIDCGAGCLVNVEEDPTEHVNLAHDPKHAGTLKALQETLEALNKDLFNPGKSVYMTEIFPTTVRSTAPGVINFWLSVGAITSAASVGELLVVSPELPMLFMAIGMIAGGILMYFCEESFGEPLRDCSPHAAASAASYGACESSPEVTGLPS
eukprot:s24_g20.t3